MSLFYSRREYGWRNITLQDTCPGGRKGIRKNFQLNLTMAPPSANSKAVLVRFQSLGQHTWHKQHIKKESHSFNHSPRRFQYPVTKCSVACGKTVTVVRLHGRETSLLNDIIINKEKENGAGVWIFPSRIHAQQPKNVYIYLSILSQTGKQTCTTCTFGEHLPKLQPVGMSLWLHFYNSSIYAKLPFTLWR